MKSLFVSFAFLWIACAFIKTSQAQDEPCSDTGDGIGLTVESTSSDTISISWSRSQITDETDPSVNQTQVSYFLASLGHNWIRNEDEKWERINAKYADREKYTLTDLHPHAGYDVQVNFLLSNGTRKCSEVIHVSTQVQIPVVENLRIVGDTLKWVPIESIRIREYIIEKRNESEEGSHRSYIGEWEKVELDDSNKIRNGSWDIDVTYDQYYRFTVYAEAIDGERGDSASPTPLYIKQKSGNEYLIRIVLPSIIGLVVVILFFFYHHKKRKDRIIKVPDRIELPEAIDWELIKLRGVNEENSGSLPTIPRDFFRFGVRLGSGAFGEVYQAKIHKGIHRGMSVAVKTLREGAGETEKQEFMTEAFFMNKLKHANIITMIGVCKNPFYLVLELMDDDLNKYLRKSRSHGPNRSGVPHGRSKLSLLDLLNISLDIASGCQYLESQNFIHRDLAARNCLVSNHEGEKLVVKLADFGLARNIYRKQLYQKEGDGKLPIRWMAPESICDSLYTVKSDVWSFGVVLWEVMKLGEVPYASMSNKEVIELVKGGGYLDQPLGTPDNIYNLMVECWNFEATKRPFFEYICTKLRQFQENCSKIQPNAGLFGQSTLLDLLAPTSERIMLAGMTNYAFSDDYGHTMTSDCSSRPDQYQYNQQLQYVDVELNGGSGETRYEDDYEASEATTGAE